MGERLLNYNDVKRNLIALVPELIQEDNMKKRRQMIQACIINTVGCCQLCQYPYKTNSIYNGLWTNWDNKIAPVGIHHLDQKRRAHRYDLGSLLPPGGKDEKKMKAYINILYNNIKRHVLVCLTNKYKGYKGHACHWALHNIRGSRKDLN